MQIIQPFMDQCGLGGGKVVTASSGTVQASEDVKNTLTSDYNWKQHDVVDTVLA